MHYGFKTVCPWFDLLSFVLAVDVEGPGNSVVKQGEIVSVHRQKINNSGCGLLSLCKSRLYYLLDVQR